MKKLTIRAALLLLLSACTTTGGPVQREAMLTQASALTKLSSAMESLIRYGQPQPGLDDATLLAEGTREDPALMTPFAGFKVRVLNKDRHAVVLVCTKDGQRALLEDAGCTGKMDVHHWELAAAPCEFSVSVANACGGR
jgi:hypothetical protein